MSLLVAFDESMRGQRYIGVAAVFEGSVGHRVDQLVRAQRLPWQIRFHAHGETDARRQAFLRDCIESHLVRSWVYEAPFPAARARRAIITALAEDAVKAGSGRLILERGDPERDRQDRLEIARVMRASQHDFPYSHEAPGQHCGMEIADMVAWAYGAAGVWAPRVRPLIESVRLLKA